MGATTAPTATTTPTAHCQEGERRTGGARRAPATKQPPLSTGGSRQSHRTRWLPQPGWPQWKVGGRGGPQGLAKEPGSPSGAAGREGVKGMMEVAEAVDGGQSGRRCGGGQRGRSMQGQRAGSWMERGAAGGGRGRGWWHPGGRGPWWAVLKENTGESEGRGQAGTKASFTRRQDGGRQWRHRGEKQEREAASRRSVYMGNRCRGDRKSVV